MSTEPQIDLQVADQLAEQEIAMLAAIRDALRNSAVNLAVSNIATPPSVLADFPYEGSRRLILPRAPTGGLIKVGETAERLLEHNPNRIGGAIVNAGKFPAFLYLASLGKVNAAVPGALGQVWLGAEGGSWDLRLSGLAWCGTVIAKAVGGETQFSVAEA